MRLPKTYRSGSAPAIVRSARWFGFAVLALAALLLPSAARACPSCYGSAAGPVIDGMNLAVVVMIAVTGGVFSWIVAFAVRIVRRERGDGR